MDKNGLRKRGSVSSSYISRGFGNHKAWCPIVPAEFDRCLLSWMQGALRGNRGTMAKSSWSCQTQERSEDHRVWRPLRFNVKMKPADALRRSRAGSATSLGSPPALPIRRFSTKRKPHGRKESGWYYACQCLSISTDREGWPSLKTIEMVMSNIERNVKGCISNRYYSIEQNAAGEEVCSGGRQLLGD